MNTVFMSTNTLEVFLSLSCFFSVLWRQKDGGVDKFKVQAHTSVLLYFHRDDSLYETVTQLQGK